MDTLAPFLGFLNEIVGSLLEFQNSTGMLDDFFLTLTGGISGLLALKAADVIKSIVVALQAMNSATLLANAQSMIAAAGIGALVMVVMQLISAWDNMTDAERVVTVLWAVATAATVAAVAVGAFQSALTLGIAAAAIVAGIAAIMAVIGTANKRAEQMSKMNAAMVAGGSMGSMSGAYNVPALATGAVIPPNSEFMAILGDQKSGRNLEAPEGLIRQIVREESGGGMNGVLTVRPAAGLTRYLAYELEVEKSRAGTPLVEGTRR